MLRSFLTRPHLDLLSRLRCHQCRSVAVLGRRADAILPQRYYTSSEDETDTDVDLPEEPKPAADPPHYCGRRRHLYVVLDDLTMGFSIHKLDIAMDDGSDGGYDLASRPPVHRLAVSMQCGYAWSFAALGSKILAAGQLYSRGNYVAHVYDTETAALHIVPALPPALQHPYSWHLAVAARNGLYVYSPSWRPNEQGEGGMHRLEDATMEGDEWLWVGRARWSWSSMLSPPPFTISDCKSIGVHPEEDGRTIFVSLNLIGQDLPKGRDLSGSSPIAHTYSYDTVSDDWKDHGEWDLPFCGQAHYDSELDAWVGLHSEPGYGSHSPDGHICSCDVASPTGSPTRPAWKLCNTRLFDPDDQRHLSASLVYMGRSTYCLVEVVRRDGSRWRRDPPRGNKCAIRLATFRLKYGKNGELATTKLWPDRFYPFSKYDENYMVRAF